MASVLGFSPLLAFPSTEVNRVPSKLISTKSSLNKTCQAITRNGKSHKPSLLIKAKMSTERDFLVKESTIIDDKDGIGVVGVHHVGLLCQTLETSLDFYQNLLGLKINEARPHEKLPYRGAWLWVGSEMIHLMELPNPDPLTGRPEHGGRDRHACLSIQDVNKLKAIFDKAGISYTLSRSGRPAIFARDPDGNALEFTQVD
ncbi:lactoylglutathione lyase / glyoxalase I family protein isoform X2 [Tasmannia lanceolata]|uniref:lactoylglutathione lyase / glyoxalase I family protein isoform X2 n=1 Tax=Tasmannia lanceolata TaxID=3420 RepID=UPI0040643788